MSDNETKDNQPHPESKETLEHPGIADEGLHDIHTNELEEKKEPAEGFSQIPIYLVFIFGIVIFWGGIYLAKYSSGFHPLIYDENVHPRDLVKQDEGGGYDPTVAGPKFYKKNCVACHQATGEGIPGAFPPLNGSKWVAGNEERMINILLSGLSGSITVKGKEYVGAMPGLKQFDDKDLAAVITFVRGNAEWGNNSSEVSPEKVAEMRAKYGSRTAAWSPQELEKLYPLE